MRQLPFIHPRRQAIGHHRPSELHLLRLPARNAPNRSGREIPDCNRLGRLGLFEPGHDGAVLHGDGGGFVAFLHVQGGPDEFGDDELDGEAAADGAEVGSDLALGRTGNVAGDAAGGLVDLFAFDGVAVGAGVFHDLGDILLRVGGQGGVESGQLHEGRGKFGVGASDLVEGIEDVARGGGGEDVGGGEGFFEGLASLGFGEKGGKEGRGVLRIGDGTEALELTGDRGLGIEDEEGLEGGGAERGALIKGHFADAVGVGAGLPQS